MFWIASTAFSPKLALIITCKRKKIKLVSAMGRRRKNRPKQSNGKGYQQNQQLFFGENKSEKT